MVELRLKHLIGGACVGVGRMCLGQLLAAVEAVGSHERALLLLVEYRLHVDKPRLREVELYACTLKLLVEHRYVEPVGVEPGDVASGENRSQILGYLLERRLAGHVGVGDMMHGRGLGRDGYPGIDASGARYLLAVGHDLEYRHFHDTILRDIGAGGFEIEEYYRFVEIEFHKAKRGW